VKVLIVYETKYGNTKKAAEVIGKEIESAGNEINVVKVSDVKTEELKDYEAFVIGSPTHAGSHVGSIKKFINLLSDSSFDGKKIAVFDTHTGSGGEGSGGGLLKKAKQKMEKQIQKQAPKLEKIINGLQVAVKGMKGPLIDGELDRCKEFAKKIASNL
jgi:flavodoxin